MACESLLTSQMDLMKTPSSRKALLTVVLSLLKFYYCQFAWAAKSITAMHLRKAHKQDSALHALPKEHLINVNESHLSLFQLILGKVAYCLIQG